MKKYLVIFIAILIITSCTSNEKIKLNEQIAQLEMEIKQLRDSIKTAEYTKIVETDIIGSFSNPLVKLNQETIVKFQFCNQRFYSAYELFQLEGEGEKRTLITNSKDGQFEFKFTPKTVDDNKLNFLAVFDLDSVTVEVPANIEFIVSK